MYLKMFIKNKKKNVFSKHVNQGFKSSANQGFIKVAYELLIC